jgi:membrane fusion protein (multidrug efflux system)
MNKNYFTNIHECLYSVESVENHIYLRHTAMFGILLFNQQFPRFAVKKSHALISLVVCVALLSACSKSESPAAGPNPTSTSAPNAAAAPAGPPPVAAKVIEVQPRQVSLTSEVVAQTEGAKSVDVRARIQGILQKKLYAEGQAVKQGQAMFRIEPAPFELALAQAKANLVQAQAKLEQAQRELTRLKGLLEQKAVSQREFDDADSNAKLAQAALLSTQAQVKQAELNLSYTNVTAPVAGIAGRSLQSEGSLVSPGGVDGLLTSISQADPIWVRFSLSPTEVAQLPSGSARDIQRVKLLLSKGQEYEAEGKVNFTASQVDTRLGTISLRAEFPNSAGKILPGEFVRVRIITGEKSDAITVPQEAVLQNDQGRFVYVLNEQSKATPRPVQVGAWSGKDWVITQGLNANDKVVVDNLLKVKPGATIKPVQ